MSKPDMRMGPNPRYGLCYFCRMPVRKNVSVFLAQPPGRIRRLCLTCAVNDHGLKPLFRSLQ